MTSKLLKVFALAGAFFVAAVIFIVAVIGIYLSTIVF